MKKIAVILALIMCALPLVACGDPEARDILDADGNAVATGYYKGDKLICEEVLDNNGDITKKTDYDSKGRVEKVVTYNLNVLYLEEEYTYTKEEGNYTCKATRYNNKGETVTVTETVYEGAKPVTETVTTTLGGNTDVQVCDMKYNEDGTVLLTITSNEKKIKETLEDGNGVAIYDHDFKDDGSSVKTFYNEDKLSAKVETYSTEGKLVNTKVNTYKDGITERTDNYDADGKLTSYSIYVYNGTKLKAIYKYNADGTIQSSAIYDENGKATIHSGVYMPLN